MKRIYYIYKSFYSNSKFLILSYTMLSIVSYAIMIALPIVFAKILDSAIYFEGMYTFTKYVFYALLLHVCYIIIMPSKQYIECKIETDAITQLKAKLLSRVPILSYETHKKITIGYILQVINDDLSNTGSLVVADFVEFMNQILFFAAMIFIVVNVNVYLSFVLIGISLPAVVFTKIMIPRIQRSYKECIEKSEEIKDLADSIYAGTLTIKLINAYVEINNKINTLVSQLRKLLMKYYKNTIIHSHLLTAPFMNMGQLIITIIGAYMVIKGEITVGTITILSGYFGSMCQTYLYFMNFWKTYKEKTISVDRIMKFINLQIEPNEGTDIELFISVEFYDVFYNVDNTYILENISISITKGDKILLIGENGSGKSTLVRLLVGLISPTKGKILLNGRELSTYNLHSLRQKINYIPAEPYIFSGNLNDNSFGKNVSSELIDPVKYKNIAKDGSNLSSGEKKKLQLAVNMLQNSDVYILDEPLNFVDEMSKKEFIETIKREFKDKTLIVISHEREPFDFCEHKYIMENGRIRKL